MIGMILFSQKMNQCKEKTIGKDGLTSHSEDDMGNPDDTHSTQAFHLL